MRKRGMLLMGVVLLLSLALTGTALAREQAPPSPASWILAHGWGWGRGRCGQAGLEAVAQTLGMTVEDLRLQLWGGKTLADLAEEKGVGLQALQDAVTQACTQAIRDAIEQAVEEGRLTREHADWLLQGLERGYWGPGRHGFWGFGWAWGRGWHRGWWAPKAPGSGTRWFRPFVAPGSSA